jgi:DNA-binding NtrC family response regulator
VKLDVRIIVATHRDLTEEVKKGNFREDLYYRLLGLPVPLPPLRDRGNDIIILAKYLLKQFCEDNNMPLFTLSNAAQQKLLKYHFPGNVRELKSIIELAAVMAEGKQIEDEDINYNSINREEKFVMEELSLKEYDFKIIRHFLNKYDDNVLLVAKKLDIGKSTIYRYLKEMEEESKTQQLEKIEN